jgi:phage gp46-like protein
LNQQILKISGLATGRYDLAINDAVVGTYSHDEMQRGVNLADNARTPQNGTGRKLAALCAEHHSLGSKLRTLRRVEIKHLAKVDLDDRAAVKAALEKFIAEKEAAKKDPEANSGYYIKTARTYLEEIGNEATIKERMVAIEDEIYRLNQPRTYAYSLVEQKEPTKQP